MFKIVHFQMDAACLRSCIPRFSLENWYCNDDELQLLYNDIVLVRMCFDTEFKIFHI